MEYERKVLSETRRNMRGNKEEMNEIMLEKCKKDTYAREVVSCSKNVSLGTGLHAAHEKLLRERLAEKEAEVERTKLAIKKFRQRNWSEKGFKPRDIDAIRGVFVTNKIPLESKIDPLAEENVIEVAKFS